MPRTHRIENFPLQGRIRQVLIKRPRRPNEPSPDDELFRAKQKLLEDFKANIDEICKTAEQILAIKARFDELGLDFSKELRARYKESSGEAKSKFLRVMLMDPAKHAVIIEKILLAGKRNYNMCVSAIKSLSDETKARFFQEIQGEWHREHTANLADAVLEIGNRDPEFILGNLTRKKIYRGDLHIAGTDFMYLYEAVIEKLLDGDEKIPTEYFGLMYGPDFHESYQLEDRWKLMEKHVEKHPEDEDEIGKILLKTIKAGKKDFLMYEENVVCAMWHYSELLGVDGFERFLEYVYSKKPIFISTAIDIISNEPFEKEHQEKLACVIAEELQKGNKLPFAQVAYNSAYDPRIRKIFCRVLSIKDLEIANILPKDSFRVFVYNPYNFDDCCKHEDYAFNCKSLATENLFRLMLKGQNQTIRANAARLLNLMKDSELKKAVQESQYKKRLVQAIGFSNDAKVA